MKIETDISPAKILKARGLGGDKSAQKFLASEVRRLSDKYVPMSSGAGAHMKNLAIIASDGSSIVYPGPYAHYQYYGEVMAGRPPKQYTGDSLNYHGAPMRGKQWDKRMLADKSKEIERNLETFIKKRG